LCFFRVCLPVLVFLAVVSVSLAASIRVASLCERTPRARAELRPGSCLIFLVIFCQVLNFQVRVPSPVPSGTGPVPVSRQPHGRLPRGRGCDARPGYAEVGGTLGSHLRRFSPSGGARGCRDPGSGRRRGTAGVGGPCLGVRTANPAALACGRRWGVLRPRTWTWLRAPGPVAAVAGWLSRGEVLLPGTGRITESQNSRGWKGPLWVI